MGLDRTLAKAIGFMAVAVVALASAGLLLTSTFTDELDIMFLFTPVLVAYSVLVLGISASVGVYILLQRRRDLN